VLKLTYKLISIKIFSFGKLKLMKFNDTTTNKRLSTTIWKKTSKMNEISYERAI